MYWTKQKPIKPGWYWAKNEFNTFICLIAYDKENCLCRIYSFQGLETSLDNPIHEDWEWSSEPINEPKIKNLPDAGEGYVLINGDNFSRFKPKLMTDDIWDIINECWDPVTDFSGRFHVDCIYRRKIVDCEFEFTGRRYSSVEEMMKGEGVSQQVQDIAKNLRIKDMLSSSLKWIRRIEERREELPTSFFDNCDTIFLRKEIEEFLLNN